MPATMLLLEIKRELSSFWEANVRFRFENCPVRFADSRIDPPRGLYVAVNGFADIPTVLIKIGGRMLHCYDCSICRAAFGRCLDPKLRQMQIPVILPARSFVRQRFVREHL